jgi:hypothetical protein
MRPSLSPLTPCWAVRARRSGGSLCHVSAEQPNLCGQRRKSKGSLCPEPLPWALEDLNLRPLPCQGRLAQASDLHLCWSGRRWRVTPATGLRSIVVCFGRLLDQMLTNREGGPRLPLTPIQCHVSDLHNRRPRDGGHRRSHPRYAPLPSSGSDRSQGPSRVDWCRASRSERACLLGGKDRDRRITPSAMGPHGRHQSLAQLESRCEKGIRPRRDRRGTVFRWKAGPGTITSTLRLVDRPRALGWTGRTFGIDAIHVWRFEPQGATTMASMEESFSGLVARLFRRRLQRQLDATTKTGLENLKAVAEQRQPR